MDQRQQAETEAFTVGDAAIIRGTFGHSDAEKLEAEAYLLRFFRTDHLPAALREASKPFRDLARHLVLSQKRSPERTVALRKLLEAKDAAVRNALD